VVKKGKGKSYALAPTLEAGKGGLEILYFPLSPRRRRGKIWNEEKKGGEAAT